MKKTNIITSIILAAVMLLSAQLPCLAAESSDASAVQNNTQSISLISDGFSVDKQAVYAGDIFTLSFKVKNPSNSTDLKNITLRLSGGEIFTVANDVDTIFTQTLAKGQSVQLSKSFYCSKSAAVGMYPITVSAVYEYDDGESGTLQGASEFSYSVQVKQGASSASSQADTPSFVSSFSTSKKSLQNGDSFKLNFKLTNKSATTDVKNVNIKLSGGEAFSILEDVDTIYKDKISKNSTASFSKQFVCSKNTASGNYPITASVTYEYTENGEKQQGTAEFSFSVGVTKKAEAKTTKKTALTPQLIISSFDYGKETITGGKEFTLSFKVKNNSSSIKAQNVLIKLSGGETFVVADGTDTVSVKSISAGKSVDISKKFSCLTSAVSGVYPITATISYEYIENGKQQGSNELTMSVPVVQPDKVQFQQVDLAGKTITVGEENDCSFQIVNMGQTKLSNGTIKLLDSSGKEINSAYIGNIEAGGQFASNYTLPITLNDVGETKLKLVFEYENENTDKKSIEQEFKLTVQEYSDPFENIDDGTNPVDSGDQVSTSKTPVIIGASCAAAVLLAVIIAIIVIKKKKHKKGSVTFDEKI